MKYLIVGDGRLAKHISHYFSLLNISYLSWSRRQNTIEDLHFKLAQSTHVLLLISDSSTETFVAQFERLREKTLIHMSGSLSIKGVFSAHPLNTFSHELYDLATYKSTPFILESVGPKFNELFPALENPHFYIQPEKKALYHSLCVMSGNFTTMIWQSVFNKFESELSLPKEVLLPYLVQTHKNLAAAPGESLTGPIARGDTSTIVQNLDALRNRPEQKLYYAFLNYFLEKQSAESELKNERLNI